MSRKQPPSTSGYVIQEGKGWGAIILVGVVLVFLLPSLLGAGLNIAGDTADQLTKPIPGNAKRLGEQGVSPPTTAAAQMTQQELEARMQAKSVGDGLAAARVVPPTPAPSSGLPQLDGSNTGGIAARLPVLGGAIKALTAGNGMKAIGK